MPGQNLVSGSLAQYITSVQSVLNEKLLSKKDAELTYAPLSAINSLDQSIDTLTESFEGISFGGSTGGVYASTAESSVIDGGEDNHTLGGSYVGSLVIPANQPNGLVLHFHGCLTVSTSAEVTDSVYLRIKTQSGTAIEHKFEYGIFTNEDRIIFDSYLTLTSNQIRASSLAKGQNLYNEISYNPAIENTFSVTSGWEATLEGTRTLKQLIVSKIVPPT